MQRPGFNIECNDNNKARWGYCVNCQNQRCQLDEGDDADASIGIGLQGQSTSVEMGAGWTEYFASGAGTCSPNSKAFKKIWVSVAMYEAPGKDNVYHLYRWNLNKSNKRLTVQLGTASNPATTVTLHKPR